VTMSIEHPDNLAEWQDHIAGLEGEALRSKAIAANSYRFVQTLQTDGFTAQAIGEILRMIARQFVATGQEPVQDGYVDYKALIAEDPELNALYETLDDEDPMARQRLTQTLPHRWGSTMVEDASQDKTAARAPGGLYGYPKAIQASCESASRKLKKAAITIAKNAYQKDAKVIEFLSAHQRRAKSTPARVLLAALKESAPVLASMGVKGGHPEKTAGRARYGLYGFRARTAALGLGACSQLRGHAGMIASDLHVRKAALHERLTGFLDMHAKKARCGYSRMLRMAYPEAGMKLASQGEPQSVDDWLAWEE